MPRVLCAAAILLVLAAASGASATPSAPVVANALVVASRDDPRAGRPFPGYVFVLPTAARRGIVSVDASCPGTVLGRTVPGRVSRIPATGRIPSALVCTWSIPRDRVGWTFRGSMDVATQRRLPDGSVELTVDEGRITRWIVQP